MDKLNKKLAHEAPGLSAAYPGRFRLADCGTPFLASAEEKSLRLQIPEDVSLRMMPDRLHPNANGHALWASCLESALMRMV